MLIRGAAGRKIPHSRVFQDETLYFKEKGSKKITATVIAAPIAWAIINHYYSNVISMNLNGAVQVGMGIAFIIASLLCKYGAEKDVEKRTI